MKNIKITCASKPIDYLDIYPDFQRELEIRIYNGNRNAAIILSDKKAQELIDYLSDFLKRKHEVPQAS